MHTEQALDRFVAEANIAYLGKLLATERDEPRRQTILTLLAEEEVKLAALFARRNEPMRMAS